MSKFKVGDKVKCLISYEPGKYITKGKIYTIHRFYNNDWTNTYDENRCIGFSVIYDYGEPDGYLTVRHFDNKPHRQENPTYGYLLEKMENGKI